MLSVYFIFLQYKVTDFMQLHIAENMKNFQFVNILQCDFITLQYSSLYFPPECDSELSVLPHNVNMESIANTFSPMTINLYVPIDLYDFSCF